MKQKWLLWGIIALAFILRVVALDKYPAGFTPDEASFGYDALCLLKTGKDQWGRTLPLVLESFGDFKPPLYSYILVPFVGLFGLSRPVVRLPNALLGTAAVYVVYSLVIELTRYGLRATGSKKNNFSFSIEHLALTASLLFAVSPWHIMMSRGAFEANLTTLLLPLGIYLFLRALNFNKEAPSRLKGASLNKQKHLLWSAVVFGLNLFSYHSAKLVTPLIVLFLILLYKKELLKVEKKFLFQATSIFLMFVGLTAYTFTKGAGVRVADISVFSGALEAQAQDRFNAIQGGMNPTLARILHNKYQIALSRFWSNYKQYFSYKFLFKDGPGEVTYGMIPGRGVLYCIELLFLVGFLVRSVVNRKEKMMQLLVFWILIAPVPSALTMGVGYSANRVAIMMPALQIMSTFGLFEIIRYVQKTFSRQTASGVVKVAAIVLFVSFFSFAEDYFVLSPQNTAQSMLYGNLEAAYWLKDNVGVGNKKVLVSRSLSEPHIYIAFANKWDPVEYQINTVDWQKYRGNFKFLDQVGSYGLGNYLFEKIDYNGEKSYQGYLLVGKSNEFPAYTVPQKVFKYPDGDDAIYVVASENEHFAANKTN